MSGERPPRFPFDGETKRLSWLLIRWVLRGAIILIVVPCVAFYIWAWANGETFNPGMVSHSRPEPMSYAAALGAIMYTIVFAVYRFVPLFAVWTTVCVVVAIVKRVSNWRS